MSKSTALVAMLTLVGLVVIGLLIDRRSVAQGPEALRPMPKWEYKTISPSLAAEEAGQGELNPLGEEGWELCATAPGQRGRPHLILKRPMTIRDRGDR
jgi:hypothetical protein